MKYKVKSLLKKFAFVIIVLALLISLTASIVKVRVIDVDSIRTQLIAQQTRNENNPYFVPKVVTLSGSKDKGLDYRCLSWSVERLDSGWIDNPYPDQDFFIDYYVPPNKKAIICSTPAFAAVLAAIPNKGFLYKVSPRDSGLRVRVILGSTVVDKLCRKLTRNVNCANSFMVQQQVVRYSHH